MSVYADYKVVNIPFKLLKDSRILDNELAVLVKILSYGVEFISIVELDRDFKIKKSDIAPLVDKNLLAVKTSGADILIDVNPLFAVSQQTSFTNKFQTNEVTIPSVSSFDSSINSVNAFDMPVQKPSNVVDYSFIERVSLIWNQALNSMEIEKLNTWLTMGISKADIELALQKAIFNNAKNFAYVETILLNNQTKQNSLNSITRNVELY